MRITEAVFAVIGVLSVACSAVFITWAVLIARSDMPGGHRGGWDR